MLLEGDSFGNFTNVGANATLLLMVPMDINLFLGT